MNVQVEQLLRRRAERAETELDADDVLRQVQALVDRRRRRKRNLAAAGSGVAVVAGVVALIAVVTPGTGADGGTGGRQAAGPPAASPRPAPSQRSDSASSRTSSTVSSTAPATSVPTSSGPAAPSVSPPPTGGKLVRVGSTPKKAPLAVTLAPARWYYLASVSDATIYGPKGTDANANNWAGKLALIVGENSGPTQALPLTVAGHPARIDLDSVVGWNITIGYSKSVLISIYVPTKSRLSRDQVIRLADSLQVRNVSSAAHG